MFKKKILEGKMKDLEKLCMSTVPNMIAGGTIKTYPQYINECRAPINIKLLEIMIGAKFVEKKNGEYRISYTSPIPGVGDLCPIFEVLSDFVTDIENPFIEALSQDPNAGVIDDDFIGCEKVNRKSVKDMIFKGAGGHSVTTIRLNIHDCMKLLTIGSQLRKRIYIERALVIGGILIVATGAGITARLLMKDKDDDIVIDDPAIDNNDESDDGYDDDVPVVTMDEMTVVNF